MIGEAATGGRGFRHPVAKNAPARRKRVIEVFAGSCKIASAASARGYNSESYEIARDKNENVMGGCVTQYLKDCIKRRNVALIWFGFPCSSWSRARHGRRRPGDRHGWPPPLRGDSAGEIWGLPDLYPQDQQRVAFGNRSLRWMISVLRLCLKFNVPFVVENPRSSRFWVAPPVAKFLGEVPRVDFVMCAFGAPHKKPTRLLTFKIDLSCVESQCNASVCKFSKKPHTVF